MNERPRAMPRTRERKTGSLEVVFAEKAEWRIFGGSQGMAYGIYTNMKMIFVVPDKIGRRFKKAVPAGQRSATVTDLLKSRLRATDAQMERTCERVNRLKKLNREMGEWEKFDDTTA